MCLMLPCLAWVGFLVFLGFQVYLGEREAMRGRLVALALTLVGSILTLIAFQMPWVHFAPGQYVYELLPELVRGSVSPLATLLLTLLNQRSAVELLERFESLLGLPGWALIAVMATDGWLVRVTLLLVPVVCGISLLVAGLILTQPRSGQMLGLLQAGFAFGLALLLLAQLPTLDALGTTDGFHLRLVTVLTGARLGVAVGVAWLGLLLVGFGGVAALANATAT